MTPKVIIQIVTWNSCKFIKDCLDSIFNQDFKDFSVFIIDNNSNDGTIDFIKENYSVKKIKEEFKKSNQIFILRNNKNSGFSIAHNQGLFFGQSEFVLIINPDIILERDFLKKIIRVAEENPRAGSFTGKLLQIKSGDITWEEKIKTKIIDSTGLKVFRNFRFVDRGQGEEDSGQYDKMFDIFGVSGACAFYRREALEDVKIPIIAKKNSDENQKNNRFEYFDQDFFAYQEDNDLAWRLQLAGWNALFIPDALVYHYRQIGLKEKASLMEIAKAHWSRPAMIEFINFRNHSWLLVKNIFWQNLLASFFYIAFYQFSKKTYLLFFRPKVLYKASFSFFGQVGKMIKKRKLIIKTTKISPKEIKYWLNKK